MKLKLTYSRPDGSTTDLAVTVDADCTVGALADRLASSDPQSVSPSGQTLVRGTSSGPVTLARGQAVLESGMRSGEAIALGAAPAAAVDPAAVAATLTVHSGPDAGRTFDLRPGVNLVGRGRHCAVQLSDPMVSTLHARVVVGDTVEIIDENSSNGILMAGQQVSRVSLASTDTVLLGDDVVSVARRGGAVRTGVSPAGASTVEFNRSPRVDPTYEGVELIAPEPPKPPQPQRFPVVALIMPLIMGPALVLATNNKGVLIFLLLSPMLMLGSWFDNRRAGQKAYEEGIRVFRANLADMLARGRAAQDEERRRRSIEHPGAADAVGAIGVRDQLLWTRRPEHDRFMELRFGIGTQTSRITIDRTASREVEPALVHELDGVVDEFATVERVPVVASFDRSGSVGVAGTGDTAAAVARGVVLQLVGLHSPAEVVLCGLASAQSAPRWEWAKWLPHTSSDHSPLTGEHLASTPPGCAALVAQLSDLIAARSEGESSVADAPPALPRVVVLVEDDAPVERNRVVQLAELGPAVGVHLVWVAAHTGQIPAACRSYVEIDAASGAAATGRVVEGELVSPVLVEPVSASDADALARSLSAVIDAGALVEDQSDLPMSVSFVAEAGHALAESADAVLDRWTESQSVFPSAQYPPGTARPSQRRPGGLRALVGRATGDNLYLDLRAQGPHALVGGTTGSGKSEFLQTWILGMASAYGPQRVSFLFVDYKGGAAFADCVNLPHCVGLVTDLSPLLVRRALTSLRAELRYREHLLNRHRAKDLLQLEASGNPETPPSLVIVVDEFAALVQEVPEFVDGVVDVAQRGRSLGLHLILATQRPAGVIKDNLRANTNLRVALRMADEDDSSDVVGSKVAASFDPGIPGRAIAKTGPGRLRPFQAGYVGGWTTSEAPPPLIRVETLSFGAAQPWEAPEPEAPLEAAVGPNDIERLTQRIIDAAATAQLPAPRKPWLPELAPVYDLAKLQLSRRDAELGFGVLDDPDAQDQRVVSFRPDTEGNIAVFGTGGAGKSTFLRTLAVSAGLTARGGPCVVYGLDFGSRGLSMLEALPHVGSIISADDTERTARLLHQLRDTVDERAARYAGVNASTIDEYRATAGNAQEPRVLLLIDGFAAFRATYEVGPMAVLYDLLNGIASDGRQVGVHLAITADRPAALPASLASSIQRKLALRLANEMDESTLGVPKEGFPVDTPPGRGFLDGTEVQVAVLAGSMDASVQAAATHRLAESMRRSGVAEAPSVERLADHVRLSDLPPQVDGRPTIGLADEGLTPFALDPTGMFLVAGPAGSGRSTAVSTIVTSLSAARPDMKYAYFGQRRSPLAGRRWDRRAVGMQECVDQAQSMIDAAAADWADAASWTVVIDGLGEFINSDADYPLQDLLRVCRTHGVFVIADGETTDVGGSWPLSQAVKASRHGLVLQPDQSDGDSLFRTSFPRMSRADFPPGRGMYVKAGRAHRIQVATT